MWTARAWSVQFVEPTKHALAGGRLSKKYRECTSSRFLLYGNNPTIVSFKPCYPACFTCRCRPLLLDVISEILIFFHRCLSVPADTFVLRGPITRYWLFFAIFPLNEHPIETASNTTARYHGRVGQEGPGTRIASTIFWLLAARSLERSTLSNSAKMYACRIDGMPGTANLGVPSRCVRGQPPRRRT